MFNPFRWIREWRDEIVWLLRDYGFVEPKKPEAAPQQPRPNLRPIKGGKEDNPPLDKQHDGRATALPKELHKYNTQNRQSKLAESARRLETSEEQQKTVNRQRGARIEEQKNYRRVTRDFALRDVLQSEVTSLSSCLVSFLTKKVLKKALFYIIRIAYRAKRDVGTLSVPT